MNSVPLPSPDADVAGAFTGARVLITGGGGFIGRHLTAALRGMQASVSVIGRRPAPDIGVIPAPVGTDAFHALMSSQPPFDFVFHLAASVTATGSVRTPAAEFASGVAATVDLLEQLRLQGSYSRLVYASSAAVYGRAATWPLSEADPVAPASPYGMGKLASEQYVRLYARLYGVPAASVRPFSVYGPLQLKQVVHSFMCQLQEKSGELVVMGHGTEVRDFVFVDDVVRALLLVAVRGESDGGVYNVATGIGTSIAQLARMLVRLREVSARIVFTRSVREGDQPHLVGDPSRMRALAAAPACSLAAGLEATAAWFDLAHTRAPKLEPRRMLATA